MFQEKLFLFPFLLRQWNEIFWRQITFSDFSADETRDLCVSRPTFLFYLCYDIYYHSGELVKSHKHSQDIQLCVSAKSHLTDCSGSCRRPLTRIRNHAKRSFESHGNFPHKAFWFGLVKVKAINYESLKHTRVADKITLNRSFWSW